MIDKTADFLISLSGFNSNGVELGYISDPERILAGVDYLTVLTAVGTLLMAGAIAWLWRIYRPVNTAPALFNLNAEHSARSPFSMNTMKSSGILRLDLQILDAYADGCAVIDRNGQLTYVNPAYARMHGYKTAANMRGCIWRSLYHPREMERLQRDHLSEFYQSGVWHGEAEGMKRDGLVFRQRVSLMKLADEGFVCILQDVSELRKSQVAFAQRENVYRRMFETLRDVYYEVDVSGTILEISTSVSRISGYTREDLIGRSLYDLYADSEDRSRLLAILQNENHVDDFEIRLKDVDGRAIPCSVTASLIFESEDMPPRIVGALRNISERKQAEAALRSSEERFRVAFQTSPDAVNINVLEDGEYLDINDGFTRLTGYTREETIGLTSADINVWADLADRQKLVEALKRDGSVSNLEAKFRMKDGRIRVGLMSAQIITLTGQRCILSITRDIQEWKQAEERLRESEVRYRELTDLLPQIVFEVNADGVFTYVNRFGQDFSGYDQSDLDKGVSVHDVLSPEDVVGFWDDPSSSLKMDAVQGVELSLIRKNGASAAVCVYADVITRDEKTVGLRGIAIDLSEQERLRALAARAQRLETAGIVAGQVAHDFNNLLAPLMAYPELIREELPENHRVQPHLDAMEKAAAQIAEINQQLLTLGRRGHYNTQPANLNALVSQVMESMAPLPESLKVMLDLRDDLLSAEVGISQIVRVLSNLILNARDAMNDTGTLTVSTDNIYLDRMCIRTEEVPQGEYVCVTVGDDGCGIPAELLPSIFDPFFTTKKAEDKRGSGLGLSVVHSIMQDHQGYVDVHTALDQGTTFYLYFPICRTVAMAGVSNEPRGGNERILVVDDDQVQREVTEALLTRLGYSVTRAGSGLEALELLRKGPYDLMLLDMIMPGGIDGTETLRRAKEIQPDIQAIIISGFSESDRVTEALALGAGAFVRKPLQLRILADAVRAELNRRESSTPIIH